MSKNFHFQGTNVHLGYQTPVFIPNWVKKLHFRIIFREQMYIWVKKNFIFSEIFPFLGNKCTFGGGTIPSFLVKFFHFQGTIWVPNSSFYPNRVKKTSFLVKIFPFLGNKCTFGGTKLQFLSPKKLHFQFFPFLGNKCTFGSPSGQKKLEIIFSEIGSNSFLSPKLQKNFFSEIFPFLGNKCTFGGTKLQFLSPSGQKNFIFSEDFTKLHFSIWGYQTPVFIPIGSKKLNFQ